MVHLKVDTLPEPGDRFEIGEELATGSWSQVFKAVDKETSKTVAIKMQSYEGELKTIIDDEYKILRDKCDHRNLLSFHGVYRKKVSGRAEQIWFILEFCEGGSVIDFVKRLHSVNRRISEEHIAYILREAANGLVHLHKNHYMHRDVRGSNILLTAEGEVKVCDYGLTKSTGGTFGKRSTCIGSPCWMAPEMFAPPDSKKDDELYGSRIDVWALGITAIEIADGVAPFADMHPTRAMFQIVRNPPPALYRPANWSQNFNDFITECLEKNPDNRPFLVEMLEHPFFTELIGPTGSDHHLSLELKHLLSKINVVDRIPFQEVAIWNGCLKKFDTNLEKMLVEDLCAMDRATEDKIAGMLQKRLANGDSYTFAGDVLLAINANELPGDIPSSLHEKYNCKSRSENAPHIFSVADSAYQDMLHHEEPQHILFAGESFSGKTANMMLIIDHLCYLAQGNANCGQRVQSALGVLHALINAGTPINPNSTRCALQTQVTFGSSGKLSGVIFNVFLLEKIRVSSTDMDQSNFHIFYYFYDAVSASGELDALSLEGGRKYRYLRVDDAKVETKLPYCRYDARGNAAKFQAFEDALKLMDFDDVQIQTIRKMLAAILILGNVRFAEDGKFAVIETLDEVRKVAKLLEVDEKKFEWSLVNYCLIQSGAAEKRKHTIDEARDARDVLASTIYLRLVDWIVNILNQKFAFGRAVFGDIHTISIMDMFGFECLNRNRFEQLMINSLNEQLQYHYNQRMFAFEMVEQEEEQIPHSNFKYHDNKTTVDHLMTKPYGLFFLIDDATRDRLDYNYIIDSIVNKKNAHVQRVSGHELSVAHYTGKLTYDAREFADKNRDFIPPEMIETLRVSQNEIVKVLFTNALSKTGNLTVAFEEPVKETTVFKSKWGAALVAEKQKNKKLDTLSHGQYSQVHKMRTMSGIFRANSLEILKMLSIGGNSGNTHFVRCVRPTLDYQPRAFQADMVHQQVRALSLLDTVAARQKGFPQRVVFQEFLRRYKFLAFDFDENVEMTKDNCRLLLIRLKMEGWAIGKTKVFLKYYNVEYLSRLYETQVKKIIKVQSMMRAFLAKRNVTAKLFKMRSESVQQDEPLSKSGSIDNEDAATTIQKAFRGYRVRREHGSLINNKTGKIDAETSKFLRPFAKRWKAKSIIQVLLQYRAARYQDLVNLTQQIHLYNQAAFARMKAANAPLDLDRVDARETNPTLLGPIQLSVCKLPFRLSDIEFYDSAYICDPLTGVGLPTADECSENEAWDAPLQRTRNVSSHIIDAAHSPSKAMPNNDAYQRIIGGEKSSAPPTPNYSRSPVYKHRPIVPSTSSQYQAPDVVRSETPDRSTINEQLNKIKGKLNPVKEMQILARQNTNEDDTDAPPFNFQGMLRKTNHQRASMKRVVSADDGATMVPNGNVVYRSGERTNGRPANSSRIDFDFDVNDNARPPPVAPRKLAAPMPVASERKVSFGERSNTFESIGTYVHEEIHPGILLEGYAVEL